MLDRHPLTARVAKGMLGEEVTHTRIGGQSPLPDQNADGHADHRFGHGVRKMRATHVIAGGTRREDGLTVLFCIYYFSFDNNLLEGMDF